MSRCKCAFGVCVAVLVYGPHASGHAVAADAARTWVGDRVFARDPGTTAVTVDAPGAGRRLRTTLLYLDYPVLTEDRTTVAVRVKVDGRTARGHVAKADVVRSADAVGFYTAALKAMPKNDSAHIQRGWAYHLAGEHAKAVADYDAAVAVRPTTWYVWNNRGLLRMDAGDLGGALTDADEAVKLNPTSPVPLYNRGLIHHRKKDFSAAALEYDAALALDPGYTPAYLDRGRAHEARGDCVLAARDYEWACRLDPDEPFGWARRAGLLSSHPEPARRDARRAVGFAKIGCELSSWNEPLCLAALAEAYAEGGRFDLAAKWLEKAREDPKYLKDHGPASAAALADYGRRAALRPPAPAKP